MAEMSDSNCLKQWGDLLSCTTERSEGINTRKTPQCLLRPCFLLFCAVLGVAKWLWPLHASSSDKTMSRGRKLCHFGLFISQYIFSESPKQTFHMSSYRSFPHPVISPRKTDVCDWLSEMKVIRLCLLGRGLHTLKHRDMWGMGYLKSVLIMLYWGHSWWLKGGRWVLGWWATKCLLTHTLTNKRPLFQGQQTIYLITGLFLRSGRPKPLLSLHWICLPLKLASKMFDYEERT